MPRDKARFIIGSRSNSRDRFDLEAARSKIGQNTDTFNSKPSILSGGIEIVEDLEQVEEESGEEGGENEALLLLDNSNGGGSFVTPIRKPFRVSSVYGSTTGVPHYLTLEGVAPPGLRRNESIFKLTGMINDRGGEYEKFRMSEEDMRGMKSSVKDFYRTQNEVLDGFAEVDEILDSTRILQATAGESTPILPMKPSAGREEKLNAKVKLAINVNFIINFLLLAAKIAVVLLSNSISLVASTVDSAMDFLSTVIIFGTNRVIEHKDWKSRYMYPTGKKRMEPMGVVVFSVFMIASFLQVFIESVQRLLDKNLESAVIPLTGIIVMISTIIIKVGVWFWCRRIKNSSVEALAQDAENDIVFNFFSLLFPYIGQKLNFPYLDPLGGALLSIYIVVEWSKTLLENVQKLSGKRASPQQHTRVAYLLTRFSPLILAIQHLSVYHTGDSFVVEADAILPRETSLTEAHDCGESVQYSLEQLEGIERAFVHIDISTNPLSGHIDR